MSAGGDSEPDLQRGLERRRLGAGCLGAGVESVWDNDRGMPPNPRWDEWDVWDE